MPDPTDEPRSAELAALLAQVADEMREGLQVIGPDYRYLYINDAAASAQGRSTKESLVGRTMMERYPGIEDTEMFGLLQRCMVERTSAYLENEFVFADGSRQWFDIRMEPVPEGVTILSLDIETSKRLEGRLAKAGAFVELSEITDGVVHDFSNLLMVIMTSCELLTEDLGPIGHSAREELSNIQTATERGRLLLERLSDASRASRPASSP
tara:strand:+ start:387 stop:1019 length:633 start_codon:yes stop_codon:yes gene_type:complete